jgi:glycosyltransferase involved in cell wall biosynthesis
MSAIPTGRSAAAPLVDVILPAYNGQAVIRKALDGAFAQDVPLRVIVVDDGSSDDGAEIARSYGARVTVITQANRGVSGARNTGLAASTAPYVALLDQDDVWQPGKLARQLELIAARPEVGLVFTDMRLLESDGRIVEDGFLLATPPYAALQRAPLGGGAYLLPEALAQAVVRFNFISPSTVLLRSEAIRGIGGFDEAFRLCDDADCWMRLLTRWRGIAIEEPLVLSLVWEGNESRKGDKLIWERIRMGEKAAARPELFAPGTADYFRRERPISFYRLGVLSLHAGDARAARAHLLASLREKWRLTTALALVAAVLPAPLRDGLLRMKRASGLRWAVRVE